MGRTMDYDDLAHPLSKLTAKQRGFVIDVGTRGFEKSEAYRRNFKTDGWTPLAVGNQATKLSANPVIAPILDALVKRRLEMAAAASNMTIKKLLETYIALAFVDPNELISLRVGACRYCHGEGHRYHWKENEYLDALAKWEHDQGHHKSAGKPMPDPGGGFGYQFTAAPAPDCPACEGEGVHRIVPMDTTRLSAGARMLYRGVSYTKDGPKIKFADQDKALESVGRILGAFNDRVRVDIEHRIEDLRKITSDPKEAALAYEAMLKGGALPDGVTLQ